MENKTSDVISEYYRLYKDALYRMAYSKLKDSYLAEDCVQDAFLALYEAISSGNREIKAYPFLKKVVSNRVARTIHNSCRDMKSGEESFLLFGTAERSAEDILVASEMSQLLDCALKRQPVENSVALIYHYGYGLDYKNTGKIISKSERATQKTISRTLHSVRRDIRGRE